MREGGRKGGREDAASGKWLLQPQAYPDTPKRHQGGERREARASERGRERGTIGGNEGRYRENVSVRAFPERRIKRERGKERKSGETLGWAAASGGQHRAMEGE